MTKLARPSAKKTFPAKNAGRWPSSTWLPNFAIYSSLEEKQKSYPRTIYVRDYKRVVVHASGTAHDQSDVLAFDIAGRMIFGKDGKLTPEEIPWLIRAIRENL